MSLLWKLNHCHKNGVITLPSKNLGRACNLSSECLFWSWDSYRLNCDLKENDGDGGMIAWDYYSGEKGCPPAK